MGHALNPQSPLENLLYTTVRIVAEDEEGGAWFGTGFFYQLTVEDGLNAPFLITNRHVLEGAIKIRLVFHRALQSDDNLPSGYYNGMDVAIGVDSVGYHSDSNIDLAYIPIASFLEHWRTQGAPIFYKALTPSLVPSGSEWDAFDVIEDIVMIGCPNGLFDEPNNFAIFRKGITASPLSVPYEGRPEFVADIACFGGSSGSPVFSFNPGVTFDRQTGQYALGQGRLRLVGVLYAGPIYRQVEKVILRTPVVNIDTPMHLGFAVRSSEVALMIQGVVTSSGSTTVTPYPR